MRSLRAILGREQGAAMVLVVCLYAMLILLAVTLIATVQSEASRSAQGVQRGSAFQAAEAGIDDYTAKLVDDHLYYLHYVHGGEATRQATSGTQTAAGSAWSGDLTWTYPNGKDAWKPLSNGYEYNLQVTAPTAGSQAVHIIATGRKTGSTTDSRVVEIMIRPSSVADFYRIVNGNVSFGATTTTGGKIYANGTVNHNGTATANIYAEGSITGSPTLTNGAQTYDSTTIRTVIKNPINFANFLTSLVDIQRASQVGGLNLDNASVDGWRLTFQSGGTVQAQSCMRVGGNDVADTAPTCAAPTTYPVPANGAIYAGQTVMVSGQVKGRVTVASNDDVVIADNISPFTSGTDVIGLVAKNDVIIARWTPFNLTWSAAVIAQSGTWHTWTGDGSHGTMTFTGSSATDSGGDMTMFGTRLYQYDPTFLYLPPPWFPTVEDAYTVLLFRELKAS